MASDDAPSAVTGADFLTCECEENLNLLSQHHFNKKNIFFPIQYTLVSSWSFFYLKNTLE